jgi:dTDP-4-dehydrorhamnose reductase
MRSLILGAGGMLGQALARESRRRGLDTVALSRAELDITDTETVRERLVAGAPDVVFNAAAYTDVDGCESRREYALEVNGEAVGRLAALCEERGVLLVHVSSDYVFDGTATEPYGEEAATHPLSVYGESKLLGERLAMVHEPVLVVRASWLFGPGGRNFVATIVRLLGERDELRIVDDQIGCPTYTPFLAAALFEAAGRGARGLLHYCNREAVSWFGLARAIAAAVRREVRLVPVTSDEFPRPARRPAYSVLEVGRFERLVGEPVPSWRSGLEEYLPLLRDDADGTEAASTV